MDIFDWWLLIWAARIALLLLLVGGLWIGVLYFLRYVRQENIRKLWDRGVAKVEKLSAFGVAVTLQTGKLIKVEEALEAKAEEINELRELVEDYDRRLTSIEDANLGALEGGEVDKSRRKTRKSMDRLIDLGEKSRELNEAMEESTGPLVEAVEKIQEDLKAVNQAAEKRSELIGLSSFGIGQEFSDVEGPGLLSDALQEEDDSEQKN